MWTPSVFSTNWWNHQVCPCHACLMWLDWPQNGARKSQHLLNPKDKPSPTPSVQLSSLGCVDLPGTKEPGNGKSSTTWKLSSLSRGATLSSTPRGSGLASFMENQYRCPARERTQFTLHLLMDRFSPKRKDFGSESSSETEQRVVPVEPSAEPEIMWSDLRPLPPLSPAPLPPARTLFLLSGSQHGTEQMIVH